MMRSIEEPTMLDLALEEGRIVGDARRLGDQNRLAPAVGWPPSELVEITAMVDGVAQTVRLDHGEDTLVRVPLGFAAGAWILEPRPTDSAGCPSNRPSARPFQAESSTSYGDAKKSRSRK